jgi:hypothetical protein
MPVINLKLDKLSTCTPKDTSRPVFYLAKLVEKVEGANALGQQAKGRTYYMTLEEQPPIAIGEVVALELDHHTQVEKEFKSTKYEGKMMKTIYLWYKGA